MEDKQVIFNPTNEYFKSIVGAVEENKQFQISILIKSSINPSAVDLKVYNDSLSKVEILKMEKIQSEKQGYDKYTLSLCLPKGLWWYYFIMEGVRYEGLIGRSHNYKAKLFFNDVKAWQLNVYSNEYEVPTWLGEGVMYHVFVDRFCSVGEVVPTDDKFLLPWGEMPHFKDVQGGYRCRDFFGGNLQGIISKLDYIKSLGVTILYLSPIFTAYSNNKYDTENYLEIDPMFGTESDFEELIAKAREKGIKIILDGVFNHSGSQSVYFNRNGKYGKTGAYLDKNSPYRDWYLFSKEGKYESWWGFENLPRFNAHSKSLQQFLCGENGVVDYWTKKGIGGWRLDVVDEIADNMLDKIVCSAKNANPQSAIIGEVWEDASNKLAYGVRRRYFEGKQLDSVMNYPLRRAILNFVKHKNSYELKNTLFELQNNYPNHVLMNLMNLLSSHDTRRLLNEILFNGNEISREEQSKIILSGQEKQKAIELSKYASVLQYTLFGFPCLYYGDETALCGEKDPFCRRCYPWDNQNFEHIEFYKLLGKIRKQNEALTKGTFKLLDSCDESIIFERTTPHQKITVVVNFGKDTIVLSKSKHHEDLLTGEVHKKSISIKSNQMMILKELYV